MNKKTTVGDQIEIFSHYVGELELLDKTFIAIFEGEEPALTTAKVEYNATRRRALKPLDFMLVHREQLDDETIQAIEKMRARFLENYPEEK